MRALVTGGGGFLGRYVVEQLLARGDAVTVFSRGSYPELAAAGATLVRGDLRSVEDVRDACQGIDVVYHVASKTIAHVGTRRSFYEVNVTGTENVIAACRAQGVPKLIYTSTPSVVFGERAIEGCDESLPYPDRYEDAYSETKAQAERAVRAANGDGLLTVSLRPHIVFGPRDPQLFPAVIARARSGRLPQIGDGTNVVDLTYVEDAARAHLLAADVLHPGSPAAGEVYFISQDEPVRMWDSLRELLRALDLPPPKGRIPASVVRAGGGTLEFIYVLIIVGLKLPVGDFSFKHGLIDHLFKQVLG